VVFDFFNNKNNNVIFPFLFPIIPIQNSLITLEVNIYYKGQFILSFLYKKKLETYCWVIPILPVFAGNYQKIIAKDLSKKIIRSMNEKDMYTIIKRIDENNYDSEN
jgi:hypothetical protein